LRVKNSLTAEFSPIVDFVGKKVVLNYFYKLISFRVLNYPIP